MWCTCKMPYIPPAYTGVKIFKDPKSKIYAYGYDKKGRKQIIYNTWFIEKQRTKRFKRILGLKTSINALKSKIRKVLSAPSTYPEKEVYVCVVLQLMFLCNFRIGNTKYLKDNGSYGLTTLEWKHLKFTKGSNTCTIEFNGKKGVVNKSVCDDCKVVKLLRAWKRKYKNDRDKVFRVSAKEVNEYIHKIDDKMSAKDIRTWHANYLFIKFFKAAKLLGNTDKQSRSIAIKQVAVSLHNTPAVCKKNYLLPLSLIHI